MRARRAAVITAAPGAGKTTRVPPALSADGRVLLLQPRRVAARAIARRIADERGWTLGREVGWHVRFDRRFTAETRLLVATEGVLTARLQQDPLLSDVTTIVIDEFHERSIHADVGLTLAKQAWLARADLRLVVMSATIESARVASFLDDCPVIDVPGRLHPLDIHYAAGVAPERAIADEAPRLTGALLCFLPGAAEIRRTAERLAGALAGSVPVLPLHGSLDADEQDAAVRPSTTPRIVLATNLAETTLTVPDVTVVVDAGLHKVARYDPERAIDSLETERIAQDSADQRAGRAGRTQAGRVVRLWDARDRLRAHREPEIARVDLAPPVMDVIAWGGDPRAIAWFDPPPRDRLDGALDLLRRLGAIDEGARLTPLGEQLRALPIHPRLGRVLLAAGGSAMAARACAIVAERHFLPPRHRATTCDLLAAIEHARDLPGHVIKVAGELRDAASRILGTPSPDRVDDDVFRRAVMAGYPDRVARRRAPAGDRFVMASGTGARLSRESGVAGAEFVVAVDVTSASGPGGGPAGAAYRPGAPAAEALIRIATGIEREWIDATSRSIEHELDEASGVVRAWRVDRYDAIVLGRHSAQVDLDVAARLVADGYRRRGPSEADSQLLARLAFAGAPATFDDLVAAASAGLRRLDDVDLAHHLDPESRRALQRHAPAELKLPSGRTVRLEYRDDGRVVAATKLQHVFGLTQTPRLGPKQTPVTFELLAPNGRPVQVTADLASFWTRVYPDIRGPLQARYPKHEWK